MIDRFDRVSAVAMVAILAIFVVGLLVLGSKALDIESRKLDLAEREVCHGE